MDESIKAMEQALVWNIHDVDLSDPDAEEFWFQDLTVVVTTSFTATTAAPSVAHISNGIFDEDGEDSEDENLDVDVDVKLPDVTGDILEDIEKILQGRDIGIDGIVEDMLGLTISNNATTGGGEDIMEELAQEDAKDFAKQRAQKDGEDFTQELANIPASSEESNGSHSKVSSTTGLSLLEGKKGTHIQSKTTPIASKYAYFVLLVLLLTAATHITCVFEWCSPEYHQGELHVKLAAVEYCYIIDSVE
ncbi:hypothetical protein P692DRAFT_20819973 [Suillus brevipes Sb2]|nr:hypothetical protein P692DRAFT_20819973 [Suillus brevipes Sb2]